MFFSTDYAHFDPARKSSTVAQPYLLLSKIFDHPLKDEDLESSFTLASQKCYYIELLFLIFQSAATISTKQYRHIAKTSFQSVSLAQVTSPAKFFDKKSETENVDDQSKELQILFDFLKQTEDLIEPCRANISELSDNESLKKCLHGYNAAYFSCANFQLSPETLQHSYTPMENCNLLSY